MTDNFDRAPGAGRNRAKPSITGLGEQESGRLPDVGEVAGEGEAKSSLFNQQEPLRQPRTSPSLGDSSASGDSRRTTRVPHLAHNNNSTAALAPQLASPAAVSSNLSVNAPEFYPAGYTVHSEAAVCEDGCGDFYSEPMLTELVQSFLSHLNEFPGSFESEIEPFTTMLNGWVTTEEALHELVELIYHQSTSVPNFSYTGARLCNHLSQHLTISPPSGNFRKLLLMRCQKEYEARDKAVKGDEMTRKSFHSYVLFLGELYLNLEIKSSKGQVTRADILLMALHELLDALFSNPVDGNLICAVKLLKLTGSVLEDAWKEKGKSYMEDLMRGIENIVLDAGCSRDVKQMLLRLVELRSSNWGRVHAAAAFSEATPENDPNYFMNEPTFYTAEGIPFTAADPEYSEKYQEIIDREDLLTDFFEENGTEFLAAGESYIDDDDDEMDPEIEEAFEKFCLESEKKRKQ
ncbi:polyadenylate-binding protein-interacting protein 1 [Lepisosteus oculatus]|uniref:polyadenylate-binding protein-interacting protein 1 n=1 Tax=Lepisosteus oculatus TaxID=7918 RepID=UPI0037169F25